jgi:hypothetical protein
MAMKFLLAKSLQRMLLILFSLPGTELSVGKFSMLHNQSFPIGF